MVKVLNLYACLGGNRYKWDDVADIEVTAVELDEDLSKLYKERFPNDKVVVTDAHEYLLNNFKDFDFIWSSPPCPTHSSIRVSQKNRNSFIHKYPDLKLYEEIIFLDNFFKGKWIVENVIPYYTPLIPGSKRGRHLYWSNFKIPHDLGYRAKDWGIGCTSDEVKKLCEFHEFDFYRYNGKQRRDKIARNLVDFEVGKSIFKAALGIKDKTPVVQQQLF